MFETLPMPSLQTVLIAARGVALIGAFWIFALAFTRWRSAQEQANQQLHDQLQRALVEIHSLQESVAMLGSRLAGTPRTAPAQPLQPAPTATQRGYDLALRMARNGASVDALVNNCGLPRNEAQLLARLHAARTSAAQAASSDADALSRAPAQPSAWAEWPPAEAVAGAVGRDSFWGARTPGNESASVPDAASAPPSRTRRGSLLSVAG